MHSYDQLANVEVSRKYKFHTTRLLHVCMLCCVGANAAKDDPIKKVWVWGEWGKRRIRQRNKENNLRP